MGEIPPLTEELDKPIPEQGNEMWAKITASTKNGRAEISLDNFPKESFDSLTITSPAVTVMQDVDLAY